MSRSFYRVYGIARGKDATTKGFTGLPELRLSAGERRDPNCGWRYPWLHPRSDGLEVFRSGRTGLGTTPLGGFSYVVILKSFKSFVLEVRIVKNLVASGECRVAS